MKIILLNDHTKILSLSIIKFPLKIQIYIKHIKQILVIMFRSQQEISLEI